ncbi:MAG: hypothetical protein OEX13_05440 [Gammaproteobacteria bacterium]|nr:hypothetical protein [Gammaproteobacteria bacterium]MDH5311584.1 hypothetical protein [Gammaproteobacteria bacterium]
MLSELQQHLNDIYRVEGAHDVRDYLVTDPAVAKILGRDAMLTNTQESVLVVEDEGGIALSVFLDRELLDRLGAANPMTKLRANQLADLWTVLEGISHFNYIVWSASRERPVTLLELELQAEVDKFVSTLLLAVEQGDRDLVNRLHGWLFDQVSFKAELEPEQYERYRAANEYAARLCNGLRQGLIDRSGGAMEELRRFYRLTQSEKISHIHSRAWARAGWQG